MAEINLTQAEAETLIEMEKHRVDDKEYQFPTPGTRLTVPLTSPDKRENFLLDVSRYQIKVSKATYQNRARHVVVLMRLDIDGPPHRNPDGQEIPCPHLHIYREGYGDKWATAIPSDRYSDSGDLLSMFYSFMDHCHVTLPPTFQVGLF